MRLPFRSGQVLGMRRVPVAAEPFLRARRQLRVALEVRGEHRRGLILVPGIR